MDVIQLLVDPDAGKNLSKAFRKASRLRAYGRLLEATSWEEVVDLLGAHPAAVVVVDPYFGGTFDRERVEALVGESVSGVIAYASFGGMPADHAFHLSAIGVAAVVTLGVDDSPDLLAAALERAFGHRLLEQVITEIKKVLPPKLFWFARRAVLEAHQPVSVEEVALLVGVRGRSVQRWFAKLGLVKPKRILRWARLLNAARLISVSREDPRIVAQALGFSRYSALSGLCDELVGSAMEDRDPEQLFTLVTDRFLDEIAPRDGPENG